MKIFKPYTMDNYGRDVLLYGLKLVILECENLLCPDFKEQDPEGYKRAERYLYEAKQVTTELNNLK